MFFLSFFFKKNESVKTVSSVNSSWVRTRYQNNSNNPISFMANEVEYRKLKAKGGFAVKGDEDTVYKKGTTSVLKRYLDSSTGNAILAKSFKIKKPKSSQGKKEIARIKDEAEKMMALNLAYDYLERKTGKSSKAIDIILPYFEGEDLFDFIDHFQDIEKPTLVQVIELFRHAVDTMDELQLLHDSGWIHFDVKPENIYIDKKNHRIRLIDPEKALRKEYLNQIKATEIAGTIEYIAPEFFTQRYIKNGEAADIYSFGMVLAAMFGLMQAKGTHHGCKVDFHFDRENEKYALAQLKGFYLTRDQRKSIYSLIYDMTATNPEERISLKEAKIRLEPLLVALQAKLEKPNPDDAKNDNAESVPTLTLGKPRF
ncbi:protein kinase domain-containing protein [Aquicella lusitana]|uniref:Protein kinase-like protein n=1 Tax=Aquicella lusitana TaxID=254246 RepID=A0A370GG15_9COXI|nr:protein kinase [Aquicella lusitana]RDI42049.1 protein kinase-like protein [Aquicella lusitana]VVC74443.1 Serine/threonine-protein kinase PrkC [Aquicella lusitana]